MGIFDMFHSFLNPQEGYEAAGNESSKYYNQAQGYNQPYNQNGQDQFQRLMQQANMLGNPVDLQNQWAQSYQMSPQAQHLLGESKEAGLGAASSMGLMGSSAALNNIQNSAGNIVSNDRQNYMNDLMQKYMASIGIGQNLYGVGAGAGSQMSQNAMSQGDNQAAMAYGRKNAPGEMFGKMLGSAAGLGVNYLTGSKIASALQAGAPAAAAAAA
jgi:hypothetical protein